MTRTPVSKMSRISFTLIIVAFALMCIGAMLAQPTPAHAIATRQTDVAAAAQGNVLLGVDGTFSSAGKAAALKEINRIRKEACDKGVPDPRDPSAKLKSSDYVAMRWSSALEQIAQTRAAEAAICQSHTRPNGDSCFSAYDDGAVATFSENLAWNYSGMLDGVAQWYEEKADWVKQNSGAMTGHYESLINPSFTHIGLGTFAPSDGGWVCTAGEFTREEYYGAGQIDEAEVGVSGTYRQIVEVPASSVSGLSISGPTKLAGTITKSYKASVLAKLEDAFGSISDVSLAPLGAITWASNNESVVAVGTTGKATAKSCGSARITARCSGMSASKTVTVVPKATKLKKVAAKKKALKVTWAKQASLTKGYQVRYSLKKSMKGAKTITVKKAKKTSCTIKKLKSKKKYYVQVRTFAKVGGKLYSSDWSAKKACKTK